MHIESGSACCSSHVPTFDASSSWNLREDSYHCNAAETVAHVAGLVRVQPSQGTLKSHDFSYDTAARTLSLFALNPLAPAWTMASGEDDCEEFADEGPSCPGRGRVSCC